MPKSVTHQQVVQRPQVFLLMGQSNMSGRGDLAALPQQVPNPNILLFGNDDVLKTALEPLDSPVGQIDMVSADNLAAVGPGMSFARTLRTSFGLRSIILVPCAKGGSSLAQWSPNPSPSTLYGSCLRRAKAAITEGAELGGVLWYQGETDAASLSETALWPSRMATLVFRLRQDLRSTTLPWVVVGLADYPAAGPRPYPGWSEIQRAQLRLPRQIRNLAHVSAAGLSTNADSLHLDTVAHEQLGPKLAAAIMGLKIKPRTRR
jgi:Carbohydrate esterase, sialic acid-specific acetylesterase